MKFRCRMNDVAAMRDFSNIVTAVSRISKMSVMRLTENMLYFILENDRAPSAWAELGYTHFFDKYTMVGLSEEHNEIYLEFDATMLSKSMFSLKMNAKSAEIKLTNKQQPCLTLEIELPSLSSESKQVLHDIPVRVIPRREWISYQTPSIPEFDITLDMPELKDVRNVVERLKTMATHVIIDADKDGHLSLKIKGYWADISTHFSNLHVWDSKQPSVTVTIELKLFLMFLTWDLIHPTNVKCNILNEQTVNFNFIINDYLTIQYFIPAVEE